MPRATIQDVANLAGVSTATVSHVVNNTRHVTEETRSRVMKAVVELNYRPLASARSLAKMESQLIGIVLPDIKNPFFIDIYKGIESVLSPYGYDLILANTDEDEERQEAIINTLLARQVDGIILAPCGNYSPLVCSLKDEKVPVVLVDREAEGCNFRIVKVDNKEAAYGAIVHLIEDGHERIGFIGGLVSADKKVSAVVERKSGYLQALLEYKIKTRSEWIHTAGKSTQDEAFLFAKNMLSDEKRPTAIFTTNNLAALGVLHAFRSLNLRCPEDVGLISFDDHNWTDIFSPPISVVRQPTFALGAKVSALLIHEISNSIVEVNSNEILKCKLVIRGSCSVKCLNSYMENVKENYMIV